MQFKPTYWPTIVTFPAMALLLWLGIWQVERLQEKTTFIEELNIRGAAAAIPLPSNDRISADDLVFRKIVVTGRFMHEAEMRLLNQVRGGIPGVNIFTPLARDDGAGTVLVNRGWAPFDWPGTAIEDDERGPVSVEISGVVRIPQPPGWLTPDNQPEQNAWYYIDLVAMGRAAGLLPITEYYIFATGEKYLSDEPAPLLAPDPNEWRIDLPNNHLSYAIVWFSLAVALFAIYVIYHSKRRDADDN